MEKIYIKLADRVIEISANYPETKFFFRDYIIEGIPDNTDMNITVTNEDITNEREKAGVAGLIKASDRYLETLVIHRKISEELPRYQTIMFHGSAIALDGEVYLFTAPSGTGKSTHARLWRECFGDRTFMVNDDKPFLRLCEDGTVMVYGSPWNGKHRLGTNTARPLKAVCILSQAKENRIRPVSAKDGFQTLYTQTYRPMSSGDAMKQTLNVISGVLNCPLWHLECDISKDAVRTSYEAMSGKVMEDD